MDIYVGNLLYTLNEDELRAAFAAYGEVSSVKIVTDKFTGQSKGFGFVGMPRREEAERAMQTLNGSQLKGRTIRTNEARQRTERGERRDRPRRDFG